MSKADSAEKKLSKISLENKSLPQQVGLLVDIRDQIRTLDDDITNEEVNLGDWKRTKAREWMGVLFGGLLECSEKGTVVAKFGRTIIGYVSTEKTEPGLPRARYSGHAQVRLLVAEAERELHKIASVIGVGDGTLQPQSEVRIGDIPEDPPLSPSSPLQPTPTHPPQPHAPSTLPNNLLSNRQHLGDFGEYNPDPQPQTYAPGQRNRLPSFDQPSPTSSARSNTFVPSPPQGGSNFTPGHQPRLSPTNPFTRSTHPPGPSYVERNPVPTPIPESSDEHDGVGSPYLNPTEDDGSSRHSDEERLSDSGSSSGEGWKVRWGGVRDVDMELEKWYAEETGKSNESMCWCLMALRVWN
jgi:hypothetical protein